MSLHAQLSPEAIEKLRMQKRNNSIGSLVIGLLVVMLLALITGLFMIPLTQKPSYYGYLSSVLQGAGVAPDAQGAGPLTNVVDFQFK